MAAARSMHSCSTCWPLRTFRRTFMAMSFGSDWCLCCVTAQPVPGRPLCGTVQSHLSYITRQQVRSSLPLPFEGPCALPFTLQDNDHASAYQHRPDQWVHLRDVDDGPPADRLGQRARPHTHRERSRRRGRLTRARRRWWWCWSGCASTCAQAREGTACHLSRPAGSGTAAHRLSSPLGPVNST